MQSTTAIQRVDYKAKGRHREVGEGPGGVSEVQWRHTAGRGEVEGMYDPPYFLTCHHKLQLSHIFASFFLQKRALFIPFSWNVLPWPRLPLLEGCLSFKVQLR